MDVTFDPDLYDRTQLYLLWSVIYKDYDFDSPNKGSFEVLIHDTLLNEIGLEKFNAYCDRLDGSHEMIERFNRSQIPYSENEEE